MSEDAPDVRPSPRFPIKPSPQQVRQLAAALLVDTLSVMGRGVPSQRVDAGKLQARLWDHHGEFGPEFERVHGESAYREYESWLTSLPNIGDSSQLSAPQLFAIRSRAYAVLGILAEGKPADAGEVLWALYKQAVFAHHLLRTSQSLRGELRSVKVMIEVVNRHSRPRMQLGWSHGLMAEDVIDVVVSRLLQSEALFGDMRQWIRALQSIPADPNRCAAEDDPSEIRKSIDGALAVRSKERNDDIQRAIAEVFALLELEHELIEDSRIDSFCQNFRIGLDERFSLGPRGHLELGSALGTDACRQPHTQESELELREFVDKFLESGASVLEDSANDAESAVRSRDNSFDNYESITPSRAFIVWRGSPGSASEARRVLPTILRSAVRTAWLASCGDETFLGYFADNRYQEAPLLRWSEPKYRGAAIQSEDSGVALARPIGIHPEEFPVRDWLAFVLSQAIPGSEPAQSGFPFGINAVRILSSADELLRVDAGQSFACSMSAIEACIGGKGSDVGERVARRAARLLVPVPSDRARAIELVKRLYNIRSRVVHGDDCRVSQRQAVFMRYLASSVVYSLAGFSKAAPRFGMATSEDEIRKFLDSDVFSAGALVGTVTPVFANRVIRCDRLQSDWLLTEGVG